MLLIVDVVLDGSIVAWLSGGTAAFFVLFWYVVPLRARIGAGAGPESEDEDVHARGRSPRV